jgi:hypothetical protein
MKKTKIMFVVGLVLVIGAMFFIGCSSTPSGRAESLEEAYPDRIEKTVVGMDVNEFKSVWPEASRTGMSSDGEIYEFIYTHTTMGGIAYTYRIYTKFYFSDNKLVRYESTKGI